MNALDLAFIVALVSSFAQLVLAVILVVRENMDDE